MIETDIVVMGSGFSGLGAAIQLRKAGREDFLVLEKADNVGGTWRDNTYPGAACDVQSHLYSLSFARNRGWSREYAGWKEIGEYLRGLVGRFDLGEHLVFNTEVGASTWDEATSRWTIETNAETYRARFIIDARGFLHVPSTPKLAGAEDFTGPTLHSAQWDHSIDLTGKNVAIIGTGASAIQIAPSIAPEVGQLSVYQRSAAWTVPRWDRKFGPFWHGAFVHVPGAERLYRWFLFWLQESTTGVVFYRPGKPLAKAAEKYHAHRARKAVDDPAVAKALVPTYRLGCKRALRTDDYLPTFNRSNVELVTTGIDRITPAGILDRDGTERPADVLVYGTGFHVTDMFEMKEVTGRDGRELAEFGRTIGDESYHGQVPGFPNYFLMTGPNTNQGYTSTIISIEEQIRRCLAILDEMDKRGAAAVEPSEEAHRAFNEWLQGKLSKMVWSTGGCSSWYLDANGVNRSIWPGSLLSYRRSMRSIDADDYAWSPAPA